MVCYKARLLSTLDQGPDACEILASAYVRLESFDIYSYIVILQTQPYLVPISSTIYL